MYHFRLNSSFGKFNDLKGTDSLLSSDRYRVVDVNLTSPGLYICSNVNDQLRWSGSGTPYGVTVPHGVYSYSDIVSTLNELIRYETDDKEPMLLFNYNLFAKTIAITLRNGDVATLLFDSKTILFTLGFGRTSGGTRMSNQRPKLIGGRPPANLYIKPMSTRLSRHQEQAFGQMELSSRRGKSIFVCIAGKTRCFKMTTGSNEGLAQDDFLSSAVAVASLGLPGFPARCVKSEHLKPPSNMKAIELSLRNEHGELLEDVETDPIIIISTQ